MAKRARPLVSAKHRAAGKWGPGTFSNRLADDPGPITAEHLQHSIDKLGRAIRGEPEPSEIEPGDVVPGGDGSAKAGG